MFDPSVIQGFKAKYPDIASLDKAIAAHQGGDNLGLPMTGSEGQAPGTDPIQQMLLGIRGEYGQANQSAANDNSYNAVLDKLFGTAQASGISQIKTQYGGLQKDLAERQAAAGRFDSPVAAIPELSLATEEGQAEANLIGSLASARISPQIDMYKTQKDMDFASLQSEKDAQLALQLGSLQADAMKKPPKDWSDYLNTGLSGANTGLMTYLAFA